MWYTKANDIQMTEGDFGIDLPIKIIGPTFDEYDQVKLTVKDRMNGTTILEKFFSDVQENEIKLVLTASESARLPVGIYVYSLDWYQDGHFLCNLLPASVYKVVDKA